MQSVSEPSVSPPPSSSEPSVAGSAVLGGPADWRIGGSHGLPPRSFIVRARAGLVGGVASGLRASDGDAVYRNRGDA